MRHATIAAFVVAVLLSFSPARAQTPASSPEALAAARELVVTMKATDQFKALLPAIFRSLKPAFVQGRPDVEKDYDAIVPIILAGAEKRLGDFAEILAGIYAHNFEAAEIRDITAFYRSPTGQKLIERQPTIARESLVAGQQFGQSLAADLKQEITDELRKRGHTE